MNATRLLLAAAALVGSAALLNAGPDSRFFNRPASPAKTNDAAATATAPATTPAAASCATCACCKKA